VNGQLLAIVHQRSLVSSPLCVTVFVPSGRVFGATYDGDKLGTSTRLMRLAVGRIAQSDFFTSGPNRCAAAPPMGNPPSHANGPWQPKRMRLVS